MDKKISSNINEILEKIEKMEVDLSIIKDINILGNLTLFKEIIKNAIGKSERKARILASCFVKPKTQKQIELELKIDKGNLSRLVEELEEGKVIYPTKKGRSKLLKPSSVVEKLPLLQAIEENLGRDFLKILLFEYPI